MATRPPKFAAIPNIPHSGLADWQYTVLNSMKENVEQLAGIRGGDPSNQAVTRGTITVSNPPYQQMQRVSASGSGFTISGASVPAMEDYVKLVSDVQILANDVASLHATLNTLIQQLRG